MKGLLSSNTWSLPAWVGKPFVPLVRKVCERIQGVSYSDIHSPTTGELYMKRRWLVGGNGDDEKLVNARLHTIVRSDDDRALHSHPWACASFILEGGYWEAEPLDPKAYDRWVLENALNPSQSGLAPLVLKEGAKPFDEAELVWNWRAPGSLIFRGRGARHRLVIDDAGPPALSLFFTLPKSQTWGFFGEKGFQYWRDYLNDWPSGERGEEGFFPPDCAPKPNVYEFKGKSATEKSSPQTKILARNGLPTPTAAVNPTPAKGPGHGI